MAKRPAQLPRRPPLTRAQVGQAKYVGSPEHKDRGWWGGQPEAWVNERGVASRPGRQLTTICPLVAEQDRDLATTWVQQALTRGQFRYREADKDFPWQIWYQDRHGQFWMGQCVNSVLGEYKGWPITEEQKIEVFG
jgi:hypothetical protein